MSTIEAEVERLRVQVDRLLGRVLAKDEEFAAERVLLKGQIKQLERELKAARRAA